MTDDYKKNYINQVILRIDFPGTPLEIKDTLPKELREIILPNFPITERKELIERGVTFSKENKESKDIDVKIDKSKLTAEWHHYDKNKKKFICIAESYMYLVYKEWDSNSYKEVEGIFNKVIDALFSMNDIQVTRLGLRYINHIELLEPNPTKWDGYLNDNLLSIFKMADEGVQISKAFQNLELIISDMRLRFQYGMHNPDYPSVIKRKHFVLDYDGYCESLLDQKEIKDNLSKINEEIEKLFRNSIGPKLEKIMIEGE